MNMWMPERQQRRITAIRVYNSYVLESDTLSDSISISNIRIVF